MDASTFIVIVTAAFLIDAVRNIHKTSTTPRRHADLSMFAAIVCEMIMGITGVYVLLTAFPSAA